MSRMDLSRRQSARAMAMGWRSITNRQAKMASGRGQTSFKLHLAPECALSQLIVQPAIAPQMRWRLGAHLLFAGQKTTNRKGVSECRSSCEELVAVSIDVRMRRFIGQKGI